MPPITYAPLDARQLLNKFYRDQRSPMRAGNGATLWVARAPAIVAGLSLTPIADGHWLTGLLVAQAQRGQGLARGLVGAARLSVHGPVWLFCHPDLQGFYEKLGFTPDPPLPVPLAERLRGYQQSKFLLAMASCASLG
ncbi:GNAT family N-acetyltransferase [Pseudomonas sp. HR96]|uniref:GNAT family N-acetyltransferase n=1 Tax=Pseudomonas sp. HR96 TaxID=1027966 RepID=UPI002A74EAB9|nr:GNAT family N-acetyltransferase [Pseudomonas sp. HR96]WPP01115.1 GNAT family N-acetyltransferase [Pseudomonas sp. HR96]